MAGTTVKFMVTQTRLNHHRRSFMDNRALVQSKHQKRPRPAKRNYKVESAWTAGKNEEFRELNKPAK